MKNTIDIRPIYDNRNGVESGDLHYHIQLNLYTDTCELADVSYITSELTKCVKQMEFSLQQAEKSRKLAKGVTKEDFVNFAKGKQMLNSLYGKFVYADTDSIKGDNHDK